MGVGFLFTDRTGGASRPPYDSLNLSTVDHDTEAVLSNYAVISQRTACQRVAVCSQVHGTHVEVVGDDYPMGPLGDHPDADALITTTAGIALAIRVADCIPVLLADRDQGVIAAAHAGRVGLLAGVLEESVARMREFGATSIEAWIGPHVCPSCYEVPLQMAEQAWSQVPQSRGMSSRGTPAIDLGSAAEAILLAEGVSVTRQDPCTSCNPQYFSHRRDHGRTGRQAGIIWLEKR